MCKFAIIVILSIFIVQPCFASAKVLNHSWAFYKATFISPEGRVIDYRKNNITTSEGQAYALLRAVMVNDKKTFEKVYKWTKDNLKRQDDNLFAWLWGEKDDKYFQQDENSATDADIDIAFSLILAWRKWRNHYYLDEAKKIISDIWKQETILVNKKRILTAGYDQTQHNVVEINPSYFSPYAFRIFALYDNNDWNSLINDNYELIAKVTNATESKLPPNWITINKTTGEVAVDKDSTKSDFSYDAVRVFYRLYIDYKLYSEKKAEAMLSNIDFFIKQWEKSSTFYTNIKSTGEFRDKHEALGSMMILLPSIKLYNKKVANDIYESKIKPKYNKSGYWGLKYDYYGQNLIWFGYKEFFNFKFKKLRLPKT